MTSKQNRIIMNIENRIIAFIGSEILPGTPEQRISASQSLFDDGIIDSLGLQQLVLHLESEFDVFIEEEHLIPENFETVAGICTLVETLSTSA